MDQAQYEAFIEALRAAEKTEFKDWERDTPYFEGCLPIEVMAERGLDTLRFGPMKPVGLTDPRTGRRAHAVVQLRQDNALGTLCNMVGFQTKLKYGEQTRVFRMIPGLEKAEFARLGGIHRNTFLNSPRLLDGALRLEAEPRLRFAGQITGVEGYVESAAIGLLAGRFAAAEAQRRRDRAAAGDDRAGRPARPHHRRRRGRRLPADERQFRPVPADRGRGQEEGQGPRPQGGDERPGARRPRRLARRRPGRGRIGPRRVRLADALRSAGAAPPPSRPPACAAR